MASAAAADRGLGAVVLLLTLADISRDPIRDALFVGQAVGGVLGIVVSTRADFKRCRVDVQETVAPVVAPERCVSTSMHVPDL